VTGAFVDSMRLVSQREVDYVIEEELKKVNTFKNDVTKLFEAADEDGSGTLSWSEFETHLDDERVRAHFKNLALDITEARALFVLLDVDESDEVPIERFIQGCLRMRGDAKSIDVNMLLYENEKMLCRLTSFTEYAEAQFENIERALGVTKFHLSNLTNRSSLTNGSAATQGDTSKQWLEKRRKSFGACLGTPEAMAALGAAGSVTGASVGHHSNTGHSGSAALPAARRKSLGGMACNSRLEAALNVVACCETGGNNSEMD